MDTTKNKGKNKGKARQRIKMLCIVAAAICIIAGLALQGWVSKASSLEDIDTIFCKSQNMKTQVKAQNSGSSETLSQQYAQKLRHKKTNRLDTGDWSLILVNPRHKLPHDFSVDLIELKNGHAVDRRAYPALQAMMDDARSQGLSPLICSSYRTWEKQQELYNCQVSAYMSRGYERKKALQEAGKWVARPGYSEHQTGLALDIVSQTYQLLDKNQENTPEQRWLMKNAYRYGFILRYPEDKTQLTGIGYEPWHYRYVGKKGGKENLQKGSLPGRVFLLSTTGFSFCMCGAEKRLCAHIAHIKFFNLC